MRVTRISPSVIVSSGSPGVMANASVVVGRPDAEAVAADITRSSIGGLSGAQIDS